MRKLSIILISIFCWLQYSLWFGRNGVHDYIKIKNQVTALKIVNMTLKARNEHLFDEINDLNNGHEAIEEKARTELGMIKHNESFYRIVEIE